MEKILRKIIQEELGPFKEELHEVHDRTENVEIMVTEMRDNHGKRLGNLEVMMTRMSENHGKRLGTLEGMLSEHGKRLGTLEVMMTGMREEHGRMLGAIIESKDIQRGEIDNLRYQSALLEGTMRRSANQVLDDLQKAK